MIIYLLDFRTESNCFSFLLNQKLYIWISDYYHIQHLHLHIINCLYNKSLIDKFQEDKCKVNVNKKD